MKLTLYKSRIQYLIARRNGYLMLALSSMLINLVLITSLVFMFRAERVILVPPEIERPMWITGHNVSPAYLDSMSLYLTTLLLNVTPSNASLQHERFLKWVDGRVYSPIKTKLAIEAERLTHDHMTIHFDLSSVKSDAEHLVSRIEGDLEYKIGLEALPLKHVIYELTFSYQSGLLKLLSFEERDHAK